MINIKFDENGLIPAIAQDIRTKEVLMLAYMNAESIELTKETGFAHYYSRSRKSLWKKGETSGNVQEVVDMQIDCDGDTILLLVNQTGVACHTNERTCFNESLLNGEKAIKDGAYILYNVFDVIEDRKKNPKEGAYTNYLFEKGTDKILKKVGEEAAEVIIASKNRDKGEIAYETADLLYHLSVNLSENGMNPDDVFAELVKRYD